MTDADDEAARRKGLTFEQAEGLAPVPQQLNLREVSSQLRAVLWNYVHESIKADCTYRDFAKPIVTDRWAHVLKRIHVHRDHGMIDELSLNPDDVMARVKAIFEKGSYSEIFGWLQFVMTSNPPSGFAEQISRILKFCRAPYRVIDGCVICPMASDVEGVTIVKALDDLSAANISGAREHLRSAATELTAGNYADSIRESMHSVESVLGVLEPKGDFSKALAKLETKAKIHGGLKSGFNSIYGFSSDEQGIRHALLDKDAPSVDEADALFMLGACAAFVSYLINKARNAGLI